MHDNVCCPAGVVHPGAHWTTDGPAADTATVGHPDPWWEWFVTGVRPAAAARHPRSAIGRARLSAFADGEVLAAAVRGGWVGPDDVVLGSSGAVQPDWREQRYGLAAWSADRPGRGGVVLRVADEHDLSAFLRDADTALTTGRFVDHLLRPDVLVADLAALGADFADAGPDDRVWVGPRGRVSTSPTGAGLGSLRDRRDLLTQRWRDRNGGGTRPCTVALGAALDEQDRSDALADRPWLPRFHIVVRALRGLRAAGLHPVAVSGFGRRLDRRVAELQPGPVVDDPAAPVLAVTRHQGRNCHWVLTPDGRRRRSVPPDDAIRLEYLLAFRTRSGAVLAERRRPRAGVDPVAALDRLVSTVAGDGICADWFADLEVGARPLSPGQPVFG